jgi:hypothetical protein
MKWLLKFLALFETSRTHEPSGVNAIRLPQPTQDQLEYLTEIKRSTGQFNPNIVVGGPRPFKGD